MKKIILIPAYEPDEKLIELVKNISKQNQFEIVVVNDGSSKECKSIFDEVKKYAHLISYDRNQGKGYALKTGLKYIRDNYKDNYSIVTVDADGQHTLKDATKLLDYIEKHPNNLVLGKRIRSNKTPLKNRIGNAITMFICRLLTGLYVYDTQTGLRAFSDKLIDLMIEIDGNRYEYEMNVLLKCKELNIKIHEIEIETIYIGDNSSSHFNSIKDSFRIYRQIIKFSLSSLTSFLIDYTLYTILFLTTGNINLANIIARIVSASANFTLNRNVVFKSKDNLFKSIIQYVLLALSILILNTLLLNFFVKIVGINPLIAKVLNEFILFIFSWIIQKYIIFKGDKKDA